MNLEPELSIIVPTHNRSVLLEKCLRALSNQDQPMTRVEVLVVADDCVDDTEEVVASLKNQVPFKLHFFSHCARSASATRNLGSSFAQSQRLLFLDDDIMAGSRLVKAHLDSKGKNRVALGYSKPVLPEKPSFWQYNARLWWEDTFGEMSKPGYRFNYRDFFSGNVSMDSTFFKEVGGYNTLVDGRLEDYELGLRLIKAGAEFQFIPEAIGYHYDGTDLDIWLRRVYQEGLANVQIANIHPEIRNYLFSDAEGSYSNWNRTRYVIRWAAFSNLKVWDWVAAASLYLAHLCESLKMRGPWFHITGGLREYNYWRGVCKATGGKSNLAAWLQEAALPSPVAKDAPQINLDQINSEDDLENALSLVDTKGFRLTFRGVDILTVPPHPGNEPIQKEHIQYLLQSLVENRFIPAFALHLIQEGY
jgi:glycosyltransferase involved in cell wall biosynthesis